VLSNSVKVSNFKIFSTTVTVSVIGTTAKITTAGILIKAGQPYPMSEPVELVLGASVENQPSIELVIGELGAKPGD